MSEKNVFNLAVEILKFVLGRSWERGKKHRKGNDK